MTFKHWETQRKRNEKRRQRQAILKRAGQVLYLVLLVSVILAVAFVGGR